MSNFISIFSCLLLISVFPKEVLGDCNGISYCSECEGQKCTKCEPHYTTISGQDYCYPCDDSCYECQDEADSSQCTSCNEHYYLEYNNNLGYGHCFPCKSDLCDVCKEDLYGYQCTKCKSGYYLDGNNDCQLCYERCDTCTGTGESQCLTCKGGFYDPLNSEGEHKCEKCHDLCKKCHGPNIEDCEECKDGYYLNNNQCLECNSKCATCKGSATYCTSCKDGLYIEENDCHNCADTCKTCNGEGEYKCTSCFEGYALSYNHCYSCLDKGCSTCISVNNVVRCTNGCIPGYRKGDYDDDHDETTIRCEKCDVYYCSNCDDSVYSCNSCLDGFVKVDSYCDFCQSPCKTCHDNPTTCDSCVDGYYFDGQSCKDCPNHCLTCDNTGTKCSLCEDTFYVVNDACVPCDESCRKCHDNTNQCDDCKKGYFFEQNHCIKCSQNCLDCDSTQCFECESDFYPDGKSCAACATVCKQCNGPTADDCISCDPGYYISWNNGKRVCLKCDDSCETCYSSPSNCEKCAHGYFKDEKLYKCISCEFNCLECESLRECKQCKEGFRLYQREGESDHDCQPCKDRGCKVCDSSANECTECIDGYFPSSIEGTNFVTCSKCPSGCKKCDKSSCKDCFDGYFNNNGVCITCPPPCATCESESKCLSCANGYLFDGGSCKVQCSSSCLSCEGTPETCTSCHNGYGLKGTKCEVCMPNCRICETDWRDITECKSCNIGYYLLDGNCTKCSQSCKACVSYDVCSTCADGYYFTSMNFEPGTYYTGTCSNCSGPGHENCELCIENCNDDEQFTCSEMPICTKCTDGYYIDSENKCKQCESPCKTCTSAGNQSCTSCIEGYNLHGTICSNQDECKDNNHCDFDNSNGTEYKTLVEPLPIEFTAVSNKGNGGALKLMNYAFNGSDSTFTKCESINGGGGAIFIYNNIEPEKENSIQIALTNLTFKECKADYGAAVFIYSQYSPVEIILCKFKSNQLSSSSGTDGFKGGSALYLTVNSGNIMNCEFENNKGTGGAIKISDNFDIKPSTSRMLQQTNRSQSSIVISDCTFEIEENSDSSLFYALNKRSIMVNVNSCTFKGNLANGAHHIDGNVIEKEMPNLVINSCHFSTDQNSALNSKFLKIDLGNQVLSSKKKNKKQLSLTMFLELSIVGVTVALLILFYKKRNDNNETSVNNEAVDA